MSPALRFVPMIGDSMKPTLMQGDLAAVLPVNRYCAEGLYVIDVAGEPNIVRAHDLARGKITVSTTMPPIGRSH